MHVEMKSRAISKGDARAIHGSLGCLLDDPMRACAAQYKNIIYPKLSLPSTPSTKYSYTHWWQNGMETFQGTVQRTLQLVNYILCANIIYFKPVESINSMYTGYLVVH